MTITLHCPGCQSDALVRNGHAPNGKQVYRCRACGRQSRENPTPNAYRQARRDEILHVYQERSSLRGLTRTDRASLARPCRVGSKKPTRSGCGLPCVARRDRWSPLRLRDRSLPHVATVVGGHSIRLPQGALQDATSGQPTRR